MCWSLFGQTGDYAKGNMGKKKQQFGCWGVEEVLGWNCINSVLLGCELQFCCCAFSGFDGSAEFYTVNVNQRGANRQLELAEWAKKDHQKVN